MNAAEISAVATPSAIQSPSLQTCTDARPCVLLVEDDAAVRRYLEVVLERAGYAVKTAADGLEAMKMVMSAGFDAVVTDAIMPHLGGQELCRFIRRHPKLSKLPVIILSALESTNTASEDSEANARLAKPVRPDELASCIARLLE
ncbi:MAG TPA: response regulator [Pyrinomonadaceae bacterium]|nr:response regulator [Pyrinomonadaceae bacterium]